jgi:hypothetical protein
MNTVYIYTLEHPITEEIRYVGKTRNPKMRFHNHCNRSHNKKSHKRNWINNLRKEGLKPVMKILDEVLESEWRFWERFWINQFRQWNFNLVNHTSGGDGLTLGNQTSFKKGHITWNKGTAKEKILKGNRGKTDESIKNYFKPNSIPWNKGKKNYKLSGKKQSIRVLQYTLDNIFIKEFEGCREAAKEMNCIPENIRRCCAGKSKSAKGYRWKYKN